MGRWRCGISILFAVCAAGCSDDEVPGGAADPRSAADAEPPPPAPPAAPVVRGDHIGVYRPQTGTFFLRGARPGWAETEPDVEVTFGAPLATPLVGDWDGDGSQTVGVFDPGSRTFRLRSSSTAGDGDVEVVFGQAGDLPVVGDWDGDGDDTVGVLRVTAGQPTFHLRQSNEAGPADLVVSYGSPGDVPLAGDWDGDGVTTIGVYRPSTRVFHLRDSNTSGVADLTVPLGDAGDLPVVGDWDADGVTTVGVWRPASDVFYLVDRGTLDPNPIHVAYGAPGDVPISGNWGSHDPGSDVVMPSLTDFFPLGVDFQHSSSFATWKARGINTVVRVPFNIEPIDTVENWTAAANAAGLKMIREPSASYQDDDGEAGLLAIDLQDEPDLPENVAGAAALAERYAALKAINPRPVFTNFAGWHVLFKDHCDGLGDGLPTSPCYPGFLAINDVLSHDIYPVNWGLGIDVVGQVMDKLRRWKPGVSQFAYIEACDFDGNGSVPTAAEFRAQMWSAIIHGARGLFLFTARVVPPLMQDAVPDHLLAELKVQSERITSLASVLQGPIDPPGEGVSVPAPLEAGWRARDGHFYFIVLNPSNAPVEGSITVHAAPVPDAGLTVLFEDRTVGRGATDGVVTDTFAPYEVHIYRL